MRGIMQNINNFLEKDKIIIFGGWSLCLSIAFFRLSTALSSILYVMAILCMIWYCYEQKQWHCEKKYWLPLAVFVITLIPSFIVSAFPSGIWKWILDCFLYRPMGFFIPLIILKGKIDVVKKMFTVTLLVFCVEALWAVYEFYAGIEARSDGFGGPILTFGCCTTIFIAIFLVMSLDEYFPKKLRILGVIGLIVSWGALLANNTRSCWVTAGIIILFLGVKYIITSLRKLLIILIMFGFLGAMINMNPYLYHRLDSIINSAAENSVYSRMAVWNVSVRMAKDYPITGVGMCSFKNHYDNYYVSEYNGHKNIEYLNVHAHSNYFHILAEGGYPALFGFIFLLGYYFIWNLLKLKKQFNPYRMMILGVLMAFAGCGAFEYTWKFPGSIRTMWYFLGILTVLAENFEEVK